MLKIVPPIYFPEFDVTAYQDDTMFWQYYLIPGHISIRKGPNGDPVFLLIKYAFGDQDRAENPNLPRGGGYMTFDVDMAIPPDQAEPIRAKLQQIVKQQWDQLKALADRRGESVRGYRLRSFHNVNGLQSDVSLGVDDLELGLGTEGPGAPPGDKAPDVIFGTPTWTEGKFRVMAPQTEALISHRIAEGPVSLSGNNVATANMDLTPAGATFMEKTLTNLDGSGGSDLAPISVVYELKFAARVPPVTVSVEADSRSLYEATRAIAHDYEGNGCDDDSIQHSDQQLQMAVSSGLVKVRVDAGMMDLSKPENMSFLRDVQTEARKFVMDQIKDNFFEKKPAPEKPEDDKTKDFIDADKDVYYMKTDINFSSVHIAYNYQLQSVSSQPANPQGTLQTFFAGRSPQEMKKFVRTIDLDDDFFKTLGLVVTCFADWATEPIAFVEVQVRYTGRDENNLDVEKTQSFTFTKDHATDKWDPSLIGKKREYSYRSRIGFNGRDAGPFTPWKTETAPRLNVTVADPGKVAIKVLAGNVDFAQITKSIQVDLKYADAASGVGEETTTVVLGNGQLEQNFQRYIYTDWDRPVQYRTRFFLKNDQMIEGDWQDTLARQLLVNEPNSYAKLDVQLVPAGDWSNVVQTVINVKYTDPVAGYFIDGVYAVKSLDEFKSWLVVLKNVNNRKFQYRYMTTFKDGSPLTQTDWLSADGDQSIPITVRQSPRLQVKVLPNLLDFKVTPVVQTTLHYDDAQGNVHRVDTFPFTELKETSWSLPIADDARRTYRVQTTYNTADGQVITQPEVTTDVTALVVPKLVVPEVTCLVVPKLVNFVQTPVVEVNVEYRDPANGIEFDDTLIFTDATPQTFRLQVKPDSPRAYTLTVTYYLSDGKIVHREPATLDHSKVVVPQYVAGA